MALKRKADLVSSSSEESSSSSSSDDNAPAVVALPSGSTASNRTRKERRSLPSSIAAGPDLKKQRLSLGGASLAKGKKRGPRVVSYRSLDGQREFDRVFNCSSHLLSSTTALTLRPAADPLSLASFSTSQWNCRLLLP